VRQQYLPPAWLIGVEADVAVPPAPTCTAPPTCVPAEPSQPPEVTSAGVQMKNEIAPPGLGPPPVTVAVSVADVAVAAVCVVTVTGCLPSVKHSLDASVWDAELYVSSPEYSARQQYVPVAANVVAGSELACPVPSTGTSEPIFVPLPGSHPSGATSDGLQRKKLTLPPGATGVPTATVAVSVTESEAGPDCELRVASCFTIVKHSVAGAASVALS
jgi:hypothetical protein